LEFRGTKVERGTSFEQQQTDQIDIFTWLSMQFFLLIASIDSERRLSRILEEDQNAGMPFVP